MDAESKQTAVGSTSREVFRVDRSAIAYLRFTLESYDGMAVVSTVDPHEALIEVCVPSGCEDTIQALLASLKQEEGLRIEKWYPFHGSTV